MFSAFIFSSALVLVAAVIQSRDWMESFSSLTMLTAISRARALASGGR